MIKGRSHLVSHRVTLPVSLLCNCRQGESVDVNEQHFTASCHDKESLFPPVSVPYCYVFYSCSWLVSGLLVDGGSGWVVKFMTIKIFMEPQMLCHFVYLNFSLSHFFTSHEKGKRVNRFS